MLARARWRWRDELRWIGWAGKNALRRPFGTGENCYRPDREGRNMFTSIRKYTVKHGSADELAQRVRESFVPLLRQMEGFRGYYLLDGGPDVLISISMFDSADEALASSTKAADWVRNNVLEFTRGMPEVMIGNALIAETQQGRGPLNQNLN
jgi:hypothetical protein